MFKRDLGLVLAALLVALPITLFGTPESLLHDAWAQGGFTGGSATVSISGLNTADYDTGGGTSTQAMVGIALPASGGPVAAGTTTNPLNVSVPQSGNNLCSGRTILTAASQNETNCNDSSAVLYGIRAFSNSTTMYCLLVYNKATTPVAGTDVPKQTFYIAPASASGNVGGWIMPMTGDGIEYDTGLGIAVIAMDAGVCSDTGTTNGVAGIQLDIIYRDK
jgi:hypothetical protein